ncbi:hypothetical protein psal_cds_1336 [Pandoravirus salinus]|uniref:Uncharacterized protein n=1 Tax=Pandoravirus salinus TaxID=1349410 RepID=S4VZC8_9VIRU|nr:hypothetical protein psal_cds_1336 [Pandoravirus salinus]AGO85723.1 hypothetical protein psal_cds_1336 [Pandoravirus salinus]
MNRPPHRIRERRATSRIKPLLGVTDSFAVVGVDFPPPLPRSWTEVFWANLTSDHDDRLRVRIEQMDAMGLAVIDTFLIRDDSAPSFRPVAFNIDIEQANTLRKALSTPAPLVVVDGRGRQHHDLSDVARALSDYDPDGPGTTADSRYWHHDPRINNYFFAQE